MRKPKQLGFETKDIKAPKLWFGGSHLKNSHAKTKRPLHSKFPIHAVFRSERAKGARSFRHPKHFKAINDLITRAAKRYGIRVYEYANVGNHIHLLIKLPHVRAWAPFAREISGRIAQVAQSLGGKDSAQKSFWAQRPFTRVVKAWGRAYRVARDYVVLNQLEGQGWIRREEIADVTAYRKTFALQI